MFLPFVMPSAGSTSLARALMTSPVQTQDKIIPGEGVGDTSSLAPLMPCQARNGEKGQITFLKQNTGTPALEAPFALVLNINILNNINAYEKAFWILWSLGHLKCQRLFGIEPKYFILPCSGTHTCGYRAFQSPKLWRKRRLPSPPCVRGRKRRFHKKLHPTASRNPTGTS